VNKLCPFCNTAIETSLVRHIKSEHGEDTLRKAVLAEKRNGTPDVEIGDKYGISFSYLERVITQEYGTNISTITRKKSKITQWGPKVFRLETTTVWSFKNRGKWATHDGRYRGNWSPYIPRNLILRYSQPHEVVLDYFSGGGTTAVEAKLLSRRCIARDINPDALALTKENLDFQLPQDMFSGNGQFPIQIELGDARDLSSIEDESIDLICAHPPYAGIISYSANAVDGDLSTLSVPEFIDEMQKVARESYRVLKAGRQCAILSRKWLEIVYANPNGR
jgi:SAM-dependent methyltransferase